VLPKLLDDPDAAKSQRVMQAMMGMRKIVIEELEQAALPA
jgi:predicted 3-demethylubiquinone-9 3-methyltransferase (glyoxalase superfamily)